MSPERWREIKLRKIAQALDAAHGQGVIHRDLKPANIMLQTAGREEYVKIIDFGIATVLETTEVAVSKQTRAVGTLPYMAPEQLQGRPTAASDIFALGVIAFEMVTGQAPFKGDSTAQQIELQRAGVEKTLRGLRAGLPEAARAAILKAIAFEPSNRYRAASEFGEAFDRALAEPDRPDPFQTTPIPLAPRQPAAPQGRWPTPDVALIIALFAAAAVGIIAWLSLAPVRGQNARRRRRKTAGARRTQPELLAGGAEESRTLSRRQAFHSAPQQRLQSWRSGSAEGEQPARRLPLRDQRIPDASRRSARFRRDVSERRRLRSGRGRSEGPDSHAELGSRDRLVYVR